MPEAVQLTTKRDRYRTADRYWESETPTTAQSGDVELRHYPAAGKLQFVKTIQNRDGSTRAGRIVTLDLSALAASPEAGNLLRMVFDDIDGA
jgi:hypothetical protein